MSTRSLPLLSLCVCESTPHNSLELPTDGWVHTVHSLSARHGEMENPVACTYPDAISSFPPLSLSLGQLPLAQLINDRMMHFQIARPSIAIWPARIRLALSLISVSLRHIVLLSLVFSPFHKAFPSSDVYREGRVVEHQNVPDLKWSTLIHLSYSMVRIRLAGSSQLYELCIKRNQEKKNFFYLAGIKTSCIRSCGETNLLPRFSL